MTKPMTAPMKTPTTYLRYAIPNAITAANVGSGFIAVLAALHQNFRLAGWAIIWAGIFDLFDGRVARLLKAQSPFGQNFDTLSDLFSFGVAPSLLFYEFGFQYLDLRGSLLSFFYLMCVMLRLARFGIPVDSATKPVKSGYFQGLSSPVSAAIAASFVLFCTRSGWTGDGSLNMAQILILVLGFLMVSHLRFPSFKSMNWKGPLGIFTLSTLAALIAVALFDPSFFVFPILCVLLFIVVVFDLTIRIRESLPPRQARVTAP